MIGFFIAVIIVIITFTSLRSSSSQNDKDSFYDERQTLIRGKAYKYAFFTAVILNFIYSLFLYEPTKDTLSPQIAVITITFIAVEVCTVYCILNDAFIRVKQNSRSIFILTGSIAAINFINAAAITENNFSRVISILIFLTFFIDLVAMITKYLSNRQGDINEKS